MIKIKVTTEPSRLAIELEIPLDAVELLPTILEPIAKLKDKLEDKDDGG